MTSIEKLAFIGKRGMGALEFVPEIERGTVAGKIDIKALADLAERIAVERDNVRILPNESLTLQSLIAVGTSAGGLQPKGIIAVDRNTGELMEQREQSQTCLDSAESRQKSTKGQIRSGQINVEPSLDYYILKFGDKSRSSAELEQAHNQK